LQALNAQYVIISGTGEDRYANAVKAVDEFMSNFECSISNL